MTFYMHTIDLRTEQIDKDQGKTKGNVKFGSTGKITIVHVGSDHKMLQEIPNDHHKKTAEVHTPNDHELKAVKRVLYELGYI